MSWKNVTLPPGGRLFEVHYFNFIHRGANFIIEIDEYGDGQFAGHAEHATDKNLLIESVNSTSLEKCLQIVVDKISQRSDF